MSIPHTLVQLRILFNIYQIQRLFIKDEKEDITIIGSPRFFWIPRYIFDKDYSYKGYTSITPVETSKNIVVADRGFRNTLSGNELMQELYNDTSTVARFSEKRA